MIPGAKLPTKWSDIWRFYTWGGELTIGNGRLKCESPNKKSSFDVAFSDVEEVRSDESSWEVIVILNTNKKGKKHKLRPTDRLGKAQSVEPLHDAILHALGK